MASMTNSNTIPMTSQLACGEVAGSASATQLPDIKTKLCYIKALPSNAGNVYIGTSSSVTAAAGTTDTTSGYALSAGQEMQYFGPNLNLLYYICDNAGDDLNYFIHS